MTDQEMLGLAAQALNMAKRDLEAGNFNFLLAGYFEGEALHRMKKVEELILKHLGENWLNSGQTKDVGFGVMRTAVDLMPPHASE